ncbi:MAG TPA: glycoside hydrolase family 18 protein [Planctomycetota bacterium]|nr:glycoside hydrolase family 18 protein [Planctomycetota bacterium]
MSIFRRCRIVPLFLLAIFASFFSEPCPAGEADAPPRKIVGYFAAWTPTSRNPFTIKSVADNGSAAKLTHLNYAFANVSNELTCKLGNAETDINMPYSAAMSVDGVADEKSGLRGSFNQLRKLKLKFPNLKVMISIGGWTWSSKFSDASLTDESRKKFVASAVDLYIKGNFTSELRGPGIFDGIDIDWEYPGQAGNSRNFRAEDKQNFTALLAEFRKQLDELGITDAKHYLLSIAAGAGNGPISKLEIDKISPLLDQINIMCYDMHGAWDKTTNFHAPLFAASDDPSHSRGCVDNAVQLFLKGGAPPEKLIVGLPFYGHGWKGVEPGPKGDGLFQPTGGNAGGGNDFKLLKDLAGFEKHHHPETKAFWLYSAEKKIFWSCDDPESIAEKMKYVVEKKLGGAMFWELSGDDSSGTLITAIEKGLK